MSPIIKLRLPGKADPIHSRAAITAIHALLTRIKPEASVDPLEEVILASQEVSLRSGIRARR